jgi:CSLREA domain-containing protein
MSRNWMTLTRAAAIVGVGVGILAVASLRGSEPSEAGAPLVVTTTEDEYDGACDLAHCSLRDAITAINTGAVPGATINLVDGATYTLTRTGSDTENLNVDGDLDVRSTAAIHAPGPLGATIKADNGQRVIDVMSAPDEPGAAGPATFAATTLFLDHVIITGGVAEGQGGGGIQVLQGASLMMTDSVVTGNTTNSSGGGIINGGMATLERVTVSGNTMTALAVAGGGIRNFGTLTMTNSTVSGNYSTVDGAGPLGGSATVGGGLYLDANATASVHFSTVTNNEAGQGGGVWVGTNAELVVADSIIADNFGGDCFESFGMVSSQGHNLDSDGTCGLSASGDMPEMDPLLGPLQDNGGFTDTHALMMNSPAIDAADDDTCPATDQRGESRPKGDHCDMGAYESNLLPSTATPTASPTPSAEPTATVTVTPTADATPSSPPATESATPTASPAEGTDTTWGNANCSGPGHMDPPDPVDSLLTLRHDAGLGANTGDCPALGTEVDVLLASLHTWGDVDCSEAVDPIDSLKILRSDAGLSVSQEAGCPGMGAAVTLVGGV